MYDPRLEECNIEQDAITAERVKLYEMSEMIISESSGCLFITVSQKDTISYMRRGKVYVGECIER